jgi:hypothetical protein
MDPMNLTDLAQLAAADFRKGKEALLDPSLTGELASAIELALLTAVRNERRACASECARRAELWEKTEQRQETSPSAKVEARWRANEARYLADALASRR